MSSHSIKEPMLDPPITPLAALLSGAKTRGKVTTLAIAAQNLETDDDLIALVDLGGTDFSKGSVGDPHLHLNTFQLVVGTLFPQGAQAACRFRRPASERTSSPRLLSLRRLDDHPVPGRSFRRGKAQRRVRHLENL